MEKSRHTKTLIIGSGPAGYTAGIYAARAMLNPLIIEGLEPGGQLMITTEIENWPGKITEGPALMAEMAEHARKMGAETISDYIISIDLSKRPFTAKGDSGMTYTADTVILATGAQARWLGLTSEEMYKGFGVSACATCDGFFYRGREVVVIGGGNTAVEEALFLTNFAQKVTLIHRRNELRAEKVMQDRLFKNEKVEVIWDHTVEEIIGEANPKAVSGVRIASTKTGETSVIKCDGVFIAIGHSPASSLVEGQLELHRGGFVKTIPGSTETAIPGVFAAGDLTDDKFRQAITSAGMGCMAALEAERYLAGNE